MCRPFHLHPVALAGLIPGLKTSLILGCLSHAETSQPPPSLTRAQEQQLRELASRGQQEPCEPGLAAGWG